MGKFSGLLRSGQIKRWQEQISQAVDAAITALGGGGASGLLSELDILETQRTSSNQTVANGETLLLQTTLFNQGDIAYDPGTGIYTLVPGKTYELAAYLHFINYGGDEMQINWVQADTESFLDESLIGVYVADDGATSSSSSPGPHGIYKPANATEARIKLKNVGVQTAELQSFVSGAIIKQLR
jgi:hypothetical protein